MSDFDFILRVRAGETEAFSPLVRKYQQRLLRHLERRVSDPETAKDLTQEVWLKAYRAIQTFRAESAFSSWLYRIAENVCIDFFRKQKHDTEPLHVIAEDRITATEACPSRALERAELRSRLRDAIRDLPPMRRRVFCLYYHQELSIKAIASRLNRSEGEPDQDASAQRTSPAPRPFETLPHGGEHMTKLDRREGLLTRIEPSETLLISGKEVHRLLFHVQGEPRAIAAVSDEGTAYYSLQHDPRFLPDTRVRYYMAGGLCLAIRIATPADSKQRDPETDIETLKDIAETNMMLSIGELHALFAQFPADSPQAYAIALQLRRGLNLWDLRQIR